MLKISRLVSIVAVFALLGSASFAGSRAARSNGKYFTLGGTVISIDSKERTLLIRERLSKQLYVVEIPDGVTFKITFGRYMRMSEPGFDDVYLNERVEIRCIRTDREHLAQLKDARPAIRLTATK